METALHDIIVIGASAGGIEAISAILSKLPTDLPAAIFVVQHMAPTSTGDHYIALMNNVSTLQCKFAEHGETFQKSQVYIAPPDHHMLIKDNILMVLKGPHENRFRPSVDALFRSAAVYHGARVIGVVLSGMLDDGTAGMIAIKKCNGLAIVQNPKEAAYPDMPTSALHNVIVDFATNVSDIGKLLTDLVQLPADISVPVPEDVKKEALIAERMHASIEDMHSLGEIAPYSCSECGGSLWEIDKHGYTRYRCHAGHTFTVPTLLKSQTEGLEETLWVAMRLMEERRNLLLRSAALDQQKGLNRLSDQHLQKAEELARHIERLREMLSADKQTGGNTITS